MAFTRRHLPHWIPEDTAVFVTWRLADTLPREAGVVDVKTPTDRVRSGPTWLKDSRIADVVVNALLYGETVRRFYELHAWVVMPNHVHAIFQPHSELPTIMRWLKGRTGRVANQILGRTGTPFWQDESFDHWVRSAEELRCSLKAGLVEAKEQWRWSSAGWVTDDKNRSSVPPDLTNLTKMEKLQGIQG